MTRKGMKPILVAEKRPACASSDTACIHTLSLECTCLDLLAQLYPEALRNGIV